MKDEEICKEKCEFVVHPCNFKVEIKEVKPFHVGALKSIVLDIKVINHCNANSFIEIKSKPIYGNVYLLNSSTLVYKSTKKFSGLDMFQILVEDECGRICTENILIQVIR